MKQRPNNVNHQKGLVLIYHFFVWMCPAELVPDRIQGVDYGCQRITDFLDLLMLCDFILEPRMTLPEPFKQRRY